MITGIQFVLNYFCLFQAKKDNEHLHQKHRYHNGSMIYSTPLYI